MARPLTAARRVRGWRSQHPNYLHMVSQEACRPGPDVATRRAVVSPCTGRPPDHLTFHHLVIVVIDSREASTFDSRR